MVGCLHIFKSCCSHACNVAWLHACTLSWLQDPGPNTPSTTFSGLVRYIKKILSSSDSIQKAYEDQPTQWGSANVQQGQPDTLDLSVYFTVPGLNAEGVVVGMGNATGSSPTGSVRIQSPTSASSGTDKKKAQADKARVAQQEAATARLVLMRTEAPYSFLSNGKENHNPDTQKAPLELTANEKKAVSNMLMTC